MPRKNPDLDSEQVGYERLAKAYANTIWLDRKRVEIYREIEPENTVKITELDNSIKDNQAWLAKLYEDWAGYGTPDETLKDVKAQAQVELIKVELDNLTADSKTHIISARINSSIDATKNAKAITASKNEAIRLEKHIEAFRKLKEAYV